MGKMHELLAVETAIAGNYNRDIDETLHVLGKAENFRKTSEVKKHFDADKSVLDDQKNTENVTTVPDRLAWHSGFLAKYLDVQVQKDRTNQQAKADITLDDGTVLLKDVPATTLLMLETKLGVDLRKVIAAIPTLDAGTPWVFDSSQSMWKTGPVKTFVTQKQVTPVVLYAATDKHPAQVKEVTSDVPIAAIERTIYSGMVTSGQKAELLGKLDELVAAVKKARQRANATDVVSYPKFGETLMKHLFGELKLG